MANNGVMDIKTLRKLLLGILKEHGNYDIWLSKDDEGNAFLRMSKNTAINLAVDDDRKRIILFPSWYFPGLIDDPADH